MPTEIMLWRIEEGRPRVIPQDKLDLESRLEEWLREDIGLVSDELLVISQQLPTAYGGFIDLLAIDSVGNLVILELKKDRTPRDVVAQLLDYASWVQGLSHDSIEEIANAFIKDKPLDVVFREKFQTELPDLLNERHRMYVVAASIDSSTERIVKYLSETHGIDINVSTFAYFKTTDGEFLGRSLLLDEEAVQTRAESTSKRKPPLSLEELRGIAEKNGVVELFDRVLELRPLFDGTSRSQISITLVGRYGPEQNRNTILAIYPNESSADNGLALLCLADRAADYFGLSQDEFRGTFGPPVESRPGVWPDHVFYFDEDHLEKLIGLLRGAKQV